MRDIFTLFLHAIVIVIRLGCRWRWKKGPKQRWSGYFSLCPFPPWKGVFSQNGPQRSRARRCCAAKRTLHGEDRSEILDKRERGGPKWTAKMAQSLTASDMVRSSSACVLRLPDASQGYCCPGQTWDLPVPARGVCVRARGL